MADKKTTTDPQTPGPDQTTVQSPEQQNPEPQKPEHSVGAASGQVEHDPTGELARTDDRISGGDAAAQADPPGDTTGTFYEPARPGMHGEVGDNPADLAVGHNPAQEAELASGDPDGRMPATPPMAENADDTSGTLVSETPPRGVQNEVLPGDIAGEGNTDQKKSEAGPDMGSAEKVGTLKAEADKKDDTTK